MATTSDKRREVVLRRFVGSGTADGTPFDLSVTLPDCLPVVESDGAMAVFEMGNVVPPALEAIAGRLGHRRHVLGGIE